MSRAPVALAAAIAAFALAPGSAATAASARSAADTCPGFKAPAAPVRATATPSRFAVGISMRNWTANDCVSARTLRPRVVRFEFDATRPTTGNRWIRLYRSIGATPQPLATYAEVPTGPQIDALARWARSQSGTIRYLELGNEDSYAHRSGDGPESESYKARARAYGAAAKRLGQRLRGSGVGVLAQADDAGTSSSTWVDEMYAAAPNLHAWISGWVLHPYGPLYMSRLDRLTAQVGAHGGERLPVFCTELGVATDDGRALSDNYGWPTDLTYHQAALALRQEVRNLRESGRVAQVILYQSTDQARPGASSNREAYFGLMRNDGRGRKGELTQAAIGLLRNPKG